MNSLSIGSAIGAGATSLRGPIGLAGLLATPVPRDERLIEMLAGVTPADLPKLLERLEYHRIEGLAQRAVSRLPKRAVDPWLRSALRRRSQRYAAATLSQALALAEVLEALERASVPVVVMRGVRSVEAIYGDPALRPFEDHDLLVPPAEHRAARAALLRLQFEEHSWGLFRRGGVLIDLHVDPMGAHRRPSRQALFPIDVPALFGRATSGLVAGARSLILEAEDELLLLAVHLVKHSFDRLVRIADVAYFVEAKRATLDWDILHRRAASCGVSRLLEWGLASTGALGVEVRCADRPAGSEGRLERFLMRRVLAAVSSGQDAGDVSTLANPEIVEELRRMVTH